MASSFPGGLDNFTNPTATDTLDSATVPHAAQHGNANDAIEAIEGTLGVNPQGSSATVVARLTALDSTVSDKVAKKSESLNVRDFGALGIGSGGATADTAAFKAAIASAATLNLPIYVPKSTSFYAITETLTTHKGLTISGSAGKRASAGGTEIRCNFNGALFQMGTDNGQPYDSNTYDGPEGFNLRNLYIKANGSNPQTLQYDGTSTYFPGSYGIKDWRGGAVVVDNVMFESFEWWFWGVCSDLNTFRNVEVRNCKQGFYLGPRSDQNTFYDFYPTLNDKIGTVDCARGLTFYSPKFVGNGSSATNPLTITNASTVTSVIDDVVFHAPWFEQLQGAANVEAFIEIGVGDTTAVKGVRLHDALAFTNPNSSASYVNYLLKTDNADNIYLGIGSQGKIQSFTALIKNVGTYAPNCQIEHPFIYRSLTSIITPVTNTSSGVLDPLVTSKTSYSHYSRSGSGVPLARFSRANNTGYVLEINTAGQMRFGDGTNNPDVALSRINAGVLGLVSGSGTTTSNELFRMGSGTTAQRPSASTVGNGATYWDTTLNALIISNGTSWISPADYVPASGLTGTTLASNVVSSSLTSFGTDPVANTQAVDNSSTKIATTAFVVGQAGSATPVVDGTAAVGTSTRFARQDHVHPTDTSRAPLASPALTGTPTTTTAAVDTNTTQIASTAFVLAQAGSATPIIDGTAAVGTSTRFARQDHVHPTDTTRAAVSGQTFTGNIVAPAVTSTSNYARIAEANTGGILQLKKATASAVPGAADYARLFIVAGTTAGTLKLVVRAGTAGAETTILDNIPQ